MNLSLWIFFPQVSWLWWNLIGFVITGGVAWLMSLPNRGQEEELQMFATLPESAGQVNWKPRYIVLGCYFVVIILISYAISFLAA